jgi:hypothetical protein
MACQLLDNLFAWGLKNESKKPTVQLGLITHTFRVGPTGKPPVQVLHGSGFGELFYSPSHIAKIEGIVLHMPASFGGVFKYSTEQSHVPPENVSVQISAPSFFFAGHYGVQFHPQPGPINGNFVPTCLPVSELGGLAGALMGVASGLIVTMQLSDAATGA